MILFRIRNFLNKSNNIHDYLRRLITFLVKCHMPILLCSKLYDMHYKYINNKLNYLFKRAFNLIQNNYDYNNNEINNKIIWVFWYQGKSHMPKLIRRCVLSIRLHSSGHKVILLTKNNIKKYTRLPKYIYSKVKSGDITLTHFSDILRFNILRNYGGLWLDSTVYCVSNLPSKCFDSLYTASQGELKLHNNVSLGKWTGFLIGGNKGQNLFVFMDEFFKLYWKYNNTLIDYFLIDYALNYAYLHNIGKFRSYVSSIKPNPYIFIMPSIGNEKCNYKQFLKVINKVVLFKLTYKTNIRDRKDTYYNYLFNYNK